ncbi:MAG: hypothetical protein EBQ92_08700 [Proteobacteria bacterium]|nr:hypothetical protein [Pseudomonadota bacterium]
MTTIRKVRSQRRLLPLIRSAPPIDATKGHEVHLLLEHKRILEGCWGLYSLLYFSPQPLTPVIHSDGTLTDTDSQLLRKLFPGCRVIHREEADRAVNAYLDSKGLSLCRKLRDTLIFGLKLFDPVLLSNADRFIVMDSDVLFFSPPVELLTSLSPDLPLRYSKDNNRSTLFDARESKELTGLTCMEDFNPGVFTVSRSKFNFQRIEKHLSSPRFWNKDGTGHYFAELTAWSIELSFALAQSLPSAYAICADPPAQHISGHYCGSPFWKAQYYTTALPHVRDLVSSRLS